MALSQRRIEAYSVALQVVFSIPHPTRRLRRLIHDSSGTSSSAPCKATILTRPTKIASVRPAGRVYNIHRVPKKLVHQLISIT